MEVSEQQKAEFLEALWSFYAHSARRELPWRQAEADGSYDPYKIMVSELMLQQTQVARVIPKYHAFLSRFPTTRALAIAELGDVLRAWQGLGYNRRAKFLWQAAQQITEQGNFPATHEELVKLPGIGANTAGAILAYAFDQPAVFVETNIRTVYLHHFFHGRLGVTDKEILSLVAQTMPLAEGKGAAREAEFISDPGAIVQAKRELYAEPKEIPAARSYVGKNVVLSHREFYWALMDYGSHLKVTVGNLNHASKHFARQSRFVGSRRQVRGQVLRLLGGGKMTLAELRATVPDERLEAVLHDLENEALIRRGPHGAYSL